MNLEGGVGAHPVEADSIVTLEGLAAGYGRKQILFDISCSIPTGSTTAILGHNGAGKTTLLKVIAGLLPCQSGRIIFRGQEVQKSGSASRRARRALALVPSERFVFSAMSVIDNLRIGLGSTTGVEASKRLDGIFGRLPILADRQKQLAGTMSGGEQRMLSLGMALARRPSLLLLDEPSLGLSPVMVESVFGFVKELVEEAEVTVVLVEQNVVQTLGIAKQVYVLRGGRIIVEGTAEEIRAQGEHEFWRLF